MPPFDPSTAKPFDPTTARPVSAPRVAAKPAPAAQPSLWDRAVSDVRGMANTVVEGVRHMPANRRAGQADLTRQYKGPASQLYRERGEDARNTIRAATTTFADDFRKPLDRTKGWAAFPARAGKTGLDAISYLFSPASAAVTALVGPEVQAATGVEKHTVGDLASGAIPVGGVFKAARSGLAETRVGRAASGAAERVAAPVRRAKAATQRVFAPETITEQARDTATLHRAAHGIRRGEAAAEHYALERHQRVVGNATPEEQDQLAKYVDTRSTGKAKLPPKLQPAADAMKGVYTRYRSRIENVLGADGPKFIKDYYARMWANSPEEVEKAMQGHSVYGGGKQGSGRNLKKRTIPTYEEGLARGLTPKFRNPIDATNAYTDNMASYLATHDVINGMRKTGMAKWAFENRVPKGMTKLEGVGVTKPAMLDPKGQLLTPRVLVADEDVARVYNRSVSKGLESGAFGGLYKGARTVSNAVSQVKLGLSAFHATVMSEESMVSAFAKGLKQVSKGDIRGGLVNMAKSPAAPITTAMKGSRLRRAVLDPDNAAFHLKGMDPRLADQFQKAGGRVNMERFYGTHSASGGFYRSIRNGTLTRDVGDALRAVGKAPVKGSLELTGKLLDTVSAPLFKEYVPRLKAGAWASQMEQWLKENPEASVKEQQRYAEGLTNNIDNRFGELIQDNQFWDRAHFQVAQLLMLSPSWNFGTVREIGGGLAELPKSVRGLIQGKGITDKTAYVGALAATFLIQNGIATYLHTGQMPEGEDWLAYRTGGTDKNGAPERGFIPGYMKDVLAFAYNFPHNVMNEAENKANPALSLASQMATNKDHFDKPIYNPNGGVGEQVGEAAGYAADQLKPISFSQPGRGPNSGFTKAETIAGIRKAPEYLENPERKAALDKRYGDREWRAKLKADRKRENAAKYSAPSTPSAAPFDPSSARPAAKGPSLIPSASASTFDPSTAAPFDPSTARPASIAAVKPGATSGGAIRPEFKPVVDFVSRLPEVDRITAENDTFHPASDVHGQGRAVDFTIKGGRVNAAAFASRLRQRLHAEGFTRVKVLDEYNNPSRGATGGHIHVQYS